MTNPYPVVISRRHRGLIALVVRFSRGGGIGRKLRRDGTLGGQEVCVHPEDITAVRPSLPGCGREGLPL